MMNIHILIICNMSKIISRMITIFAFNFASGLPDSSLLTVCGNRHISGEVKGGKAHNLQYAHTAKEWETVPTNIPIM
jgi:hypothetical protein